MWQRFVSYSRQLTVAALDLLLPRRCPGCHRVIDEENVFCVPCAISVEEVRSACERCGQPGQDNPCQRCTLDPPQFHSARAAFLYGGQLAYALRRFKYEQATYLAEPLARPLRPLLTRSAADLVIPVPLHRRRLVARGFNQAALLARSLVGGRGPPIDFDALQRTRDTRSQVGLDRRRRWRNVAGAFALRRQSVAGRRIALVDDVFTTGATASACAAILLAGGARTVEILTVARAVP